MYGGTMTTKAPEKQEPMLFTDSQARLWMSDRGQSADNWTVFFEFVGNRKEHGQMVQLYRLKGEYREANKTK